MSKTSEEIVRDEFRKLLREDFSGEFDEIPLVELGIDSLEFFEATMILEDEFGIVVPVTDLHSEITLKEIFSMI